MRWQIHATDRLRADHGADSLRGYAEALKGLLEQNALPLPRFPEMVWAQDRLPDGAEVAVGIAQEGDDLLGYVWPADKVQYLEMEEIAAEHRTEDGDARRVLLHWYRPPGE